MSPSEGKVLHQNEQTLFTSSSDRTGGVSRSRSWRARSCSAASIRAERPERETQQVLQRSEHTRRTAREGDPAGPAAQRAYAQNGQRGRPSRSCCAASIRAERPERETQISEGDVLQCDRTRKQGSIKTEGPAARRTAFGNPFREREVLEQVRQCLHRISWTRSEREREREVLEGREPTERCARASPAAQRERSWSRAATSSSDRTV